MSIWGATPGRSSVLARRGVLPARFGQGCAGQIGLTVPASGSRELTAH